MLLSQPVDLDLRSFPSIFKLLFFSARLCSKITAKRRESGANDHVVVATFSRKRKAEEVNFRLSQRPELGFKI